MGYLLAEQDELVSSNFWGLANAMGQAGVRLAATSAEILDAIERDDIDIGYNILGSYAAEAASRNPDLGIVLPRDFTIVTSRIGLVPKASANPDLGRLLLDFFMSAEGQTIMADKLQIAALNPDVPGDNTANAMQLALGNQLRPVPVSPGLMVYLDQVKRARLIKRWNDALRLQ